MTYISFMTSASPQCAINKSLPSNIPTRLISDTNGGLSLIQLRDDVLTNNVQCYTNSDTKTTQNLITIYASFKKIKVSVLDEVHRI